MSNCEEWKIVSAMLVINFAFAVVNLLMKKTLDEGVDHLVIVTYRQAISAVFLAPIALLWERKSRTEITPRILCHLFVSALVGVTLTQFLFLLGLEYTSATFSCAFLNMVPVFTFILALPFGLEKLNMRSRGGRAKILGALICIGGALVLTFYRGPKITHTHPQPSKNHAMNSPEKAKNWALGSVLLALGCLMWSSWFLMQAKIGNAFPFQYSSTAILSFFSATQSTILSVIISRNFSVWVLRGKLEIISIVYSGMVGSALCYAGMSWCVKQKGPVFTSAFTPFTQIFVAIFDFSIFHEQIHLGSLIGSMMVIMGMYTLLWGKTIEAKECLVKPNQVSENCDQDCNSVSQVLPVTINSRAS